ncbi:MAG: IS21 family transposase [Bacteroidetes bacterium]|nr:IS21 family transposase [Bacteroidota bacterium]
MAISKEKENQILRYHFVEKWKVGTIATQLGIHYSVVDRVLSQAGMPKIERSLRASIIDPYLPFIYQTLETYPKLTAARLYDMAKARGYPGAISFFRQRIAELRPRKQPEAFLRLKTLVGEQAQVDWGHFGKITIGKATRHLMAFVMVLSWSRQIFLQFYYNQQMENFLRGHVAAFTQWQGLPKILLYDNLKSAVLERQGDVIRFHPTLLQLASHYRFEPRPVAVARGNEKGRVERAIRYIRDNFFAGRQWTDIEDLNAQAACWCQGVSADRRCPEDTTVSVRDAFEKEKLALLSLPNDHFPTHNQVQVSARKTPYIRFDLNDYSIPHTHVQKTLTVNADLTHVRILEGSDVLAEHERSFDKGQQIEQQTHIDALWQHKVEAKRSSGHNRLSHASPLIETLLEQTVTRGHALKTTINLLIECLDDYGQAAFHSALDEAISQNSPHPQGIRQILERQRDEQQRPPPLSVAVPEKARQFSVKPATLSDYDNIQPQTQTQTLEENDDE